MSAIAFAVPTIKLLLAAGAFFRNGGLEAGAKAFADLLDNATKLDKLVGDLGLRDLAASLAATADQTATAFLAGQAATPDQIADARALFDQCAPRAIPTPDQFATLGLNPDRTFAYMETAARQDRDFARNDLAQSLFRAVMTPVLEKLLSDPAFTAKIEPALWRQSLGLQMATNDDTAAIREDTSSLKAMVLQLLEQSGDAAAARTSGYTDAALIELARPIVADVSDPGQAFRELRRAVEIAIEVQTRAAAGTNSGGFVAEVIRQMAALSAQGQYDAAAQTGRSAYDQWKTSETDRQQEARAVGLRLLRAEFDQHYLRRDPGAAASALMEQVRLETPYPMQEFDRQRELWFEYFTKGRELGNHFYLRIAEHIGHHCLAIAKDPERRGLAFADLGFTQATLYERNGLEVDYLRASQTYKNGQAGTSSVPSVQSEIQHRFGNLLRLAGDRHRSTIHYVDSIALFQSAIEIREKLGLEYEWATSLGNQGSTKGSLGFLMRDPTIIADGIASIGASLGVRTRKRNPLDWAHTHHNLGTICFLLASLTKVREHFVGAGTSLFAALMERTIEYRPAFYAASQNSLGRVFCALGVLERRAELFERAEQAYLKASAIQTRAEMPAQFVTVMGDLGALSIHWFDLSQEVTHLDRAAAYTLAAREVLVLSGADHYIGLADLQLADIAARRERLP